MTNFKLVDQYIKEKRLLRSSNFNVLQASNCHCGSAENFFIAGLTHQCVTCQYQEDVDVEWHFKSICIHPHLYNGWLGTIRDHKINQLI